jgi:hypothetical protein
VAVLQIWCMDPGKALVASLEILKVIYETAEQYRRIQSVSQRTLNEMALLFTLQDNIRSCRRMQNNAVIDNYLMDIHKRLVKFKNIVDGIGEKNMIMKLIYVKKMKKISSEIADAIKKLKFVLTIKNDMLQSSRMDVANIITDADGLLFWERNFGSENIYVNENLFFSALRMNTTLLSHELELVKKVINRDDDKYITAFEFQEWIEFFGGFSVIMKRTIESLLDPSTTEIATWYHENINRTMVKALLHDSSFIVRKHSHQKGVFILNFNMHDELCTLYIRNNREVNKYYMDKLPDFTRTELMAYETLEGTHITNNLMDIISRLEYTIKISNNANIGASSWQQQRSQYVDKTIEPPSSTASSQPAGSGPDGSFFSEVWSTIDNIPIVSTIANIIPTGIDVLKTGFDGINDMFVNAFTPTPPPPPPPFNHEANGIQYVVM